VNRVASALEVVGAERVQYAVDQAVLVDLAREVAVVAAAQEALLVWIDLELEASVVLVEDRARAPPRQRPAW
jgi:hypothetical protein